MNLTLKSMELAKCRGWKTAVIFVAVGFGLGLSPIASGTAGALLGVLILLGLTPVWQGPILAQIVVAVMLSAAAIPLCDVAERHFGRKDDRRIVADEFLTFPLCMVGLPLTGWVIGMAFLTNRLFDVLKPFPACRFQHLPGGLGIVADDVVSTLYSLLANLLIYRGVQYWASS